MHTLLKSSLRNCTIYRGFGRWAPSVVIYGGRNLKFSEYRLAFRWKLPKGQLEKLKRYVWLRGNGQLFIRWCLVAIKSCSLRHLGGGVAREVHGDGAKGMKFNVKALEDENGYCCSWKMVSLAWIPSFRNCVEYDIIDTRSTFLFISKSERNIDWLDG